MYMLDTNACLDFLLARRESVARRIERAFGGLTVSAVTVAELRVGNKTSADPGGDARKLDLFLSELDVAPFEAKAAARYGEIIRRMGIIRTNFDRLIAAHAMALNLILVTRNERDFADVSGLRVENWAE